MLTRAINHLAIDGMLARVTTTIVIVFCLLIAKCLSDGTWGCVYTMPMDKCL
ncbi:MAG: hypothetical protein WC196_07275 [Bacilli bacterium]